LYADDQVVIFVYLAVNSTNICLETELLAFKVKYPTR